MTRRAVRAALIAVLVLGGPCGIAAPWHATAQAETAAASAAYDGVARWLFDLYLSQSIRLTVATVSQARPEASAVIGPQVPAITKVLDRHRQEFVSAMQQPLRAHFNATEAAALAERVTKQPLDLDQATLQRLVQVDADFRRDGQKTIRALTFDLGSIVAEALSANPPSRQN